MVANDTLYQIKRGSNGAEESHWSMEASRSQTKTSQGGGKSCLLPCPIRQRASCNVTESLSHHSVKTGSGLVDEGRWTGPQCVIEFREGKA